MSARDQGAQALKSGNPQEAVTLLTQAVQENPHDPQAHAYLGTAFGSLGQIDKAAECFAQAAKLAPQSAPIRFNLGMALERAGKTGEAREAYGEVLKVDAGHEKAQQALARLGEAPAPAPAAAPEPVNSILNEFALGDAPPLPASAVAPPPPAYAPGSPLSAPAPPGAAPPAAPYGAPPSLYGAPAAPYGAPPAPPPLAPMGMQPLGDWTPPPGTPAPQAPWQPAPPPQPVPTGPSMDPAGVVMSRVDNDQGMSRSAFMGNAYLAGMGMGIWWGLIGAIVIFLTSLTQITASEMGEHMPRVITMSLMMIAGGTLGYAIVGLMSATTDDPEKFGGIFGLGIGLMTAGVLMPAVMESIGFYSVGGFLGTTWVSWKMGASVGAAVAEQQASALVVAGPGSVLVSRTR